MAENPYDPLLRYVSELGEGSWDDFKDAHDWVFGQSDDPAQQAWVVAKNMAALGHIEIAWGDRTSWAAASPVLTMLANSGARSIVTGARTKSFTAQLEAAVKSRQLYLEKKEQRHGPTTYFIACEKATDAEELAAALSIPYTFSAARQLAELLPALKSWLKRFPEGELTEGFEVEWFNARTFYWGAPGERRPGLYRCRTFHRHEYALLEQSGTWRRVTPEIGIYNVLKWAGRSVLSHSLAYNELRVPARCGLPELHARVASLCSGRAPGERRVTRTPPGRGHRQQQDVPQRYIELTYANVSLDIARKIASALDQTLSEGA